MTSSHSVEWTVPDGVSTIQVEVRGAGGKENGGAGGLVTATLDVEAGLVLTMIVGAAGSGLGLTRVSSISPPDFNHKKGGGLVGIFVGGTPYSGGTPLIVAGSGGGGGDNCGSTGGAGGGEAGQQGQWKIDCRNDWTYGEETFKGSEMVQACMGGGGTQTAGGNAGSFPLEGLNLGIDAIAGDAYMGGGHGSYGNDGGAGYYGGGGGSHCPNMSGGSGGGGSSYAIKEASDVKHVQGGGARAEGDGSIIITYA